MIGTAARLLRRARWTVLRSQAASFALQLLPFACIVLTLSYRFGGSSAMMSLAALLAAACGAWLLLCAPKYDVIWLSRQLNAAFPAFQDSAELALMDASGSTAGMQWLQRVRIQRRLEETQLPQLCAPYPWRRIRTLWCCAGGLVMVSGLIFWWGKYLQANPHVRASHTKPTPAFSGSLRITPPPYTQLPSRVVNSFDATAPAGSSVEFMVQASSAPNQVIIEFRNGESLALHRATLGWRGTLVMRDSALYRVQSDEVADAGAANHRIDIVSDQSPRIIVRRPEHTLNVLSAEQKTWDLEFDATDDYGIVSAELSITLAQGSGENIKSSEHVIDLEGSGNARHRTYRKTLDLAGLGFARGDDLIVRASVTDNHPAPANTGQSPSIILRWPAQTEAASEGMEGLVQTALPAYFSSERQIIIDTEALTAQRSALRAEKLAARADDLGIQQKVLRLRYGQFLGEEFESNAERAPKSAKRQGAAALDAVPPEHAESAAEPKEMGAEGNIVAEFGHVHDKPEAATLLDPETRRLLKSALDEMWQAELQLRQANLEQALPYEYRALAYIKQMQQAERIYLARSGVQLPQVDPNRRLTGERAGLSDRDALLPTAVSGDAPVRDLWRALHAGDAFDWTRFDRWIQAHRRELPDALGLMAAVDAVRMDPQCLHCRAELARLLWPHLARTVSALQPRAIPSDVGTAYLNALSAAATRPQ